MAANRGVFAIDRGLYNGPDRHPFFKDEPFAEREAWVWMIGECAYEPCQRRVGRAVYDLKRGQFVAATRFMAVKWKWTESRVRRLIERLKDDAMIDARPTPEATVITICSYDDYQFGRRADDEPATSPRRKEEITEENKKEGVGGASAPAQPRFQISPEAHAFAAELARLCDQDLSFLTPQWMSSQPALRAQMWLNQGWQVDLMREAAIAAVRKKRDGPPHSVVYFEKPFARAHAPQLPLPPVQVVTEHQKEGSNADAVGNRRSSGWQASRDRFREAHAKLGESVRADFDARTEGSENGDQKVVRLIAPR